MARKGNGKTTDQIYREVTDRVIQALEEGTVPWHRPWRGDDGYLHQNLTTRKTYRGVNQFLLDITAITEGYSSIYWLTFKQAIEVGRKQWLKANNLHDNEEGRKAYKESGEYRGVRKGEKGTTVVFWKILRVKDEEDKDKVKSIPLLRYYTVFNVEQCDGIEAPKVEEPEEFDPIAHAEQIVEEMPNCPEISYGGNRAFYRPATDSVRLPTRSQFETAEGFYSTTYHELVHSTGHKDRLNRPEISEKTADSTFGSEPYAKEELVAEMGASMLMSYVGLDVQPQHEQTAAYIASWLKALKDDHKLIVNAAGKAQQAVDYIVPKEDS